MNEETLPMNENVVSIRRALLYDQIRTINGQMPDAMFQEMKAMSFDQWSAIWHEALPQYSMEDFLAVHKMLWPALTVRDLIHHEVTDRPEEGPTTKELDDIEAEEAEATYDERWDVL